MDKGKQKDARGRRPGTDDQLLATQASIYENARETPKEGREQVGSRFYRTRSAGE